MNFNELMYRLSSTKKNVSHENMRQFLLYSSFIGIELQKHFIGMLEMDPKNFVQNSEGDIKMASCLGIMKPTDRISKMKVIQTNNLW